MTKFKFYQVFNKTLSHFNIHFKIQLNTCMRCVHSIHCICKFPSKFPSLNKLYYPCSRINMVFKVKSGIGKTAGWQAFHQSSCSCSWFHSQVNFNLKVLSIEIQYSKLFRSNKILSHLHTINAFGAYIITVVRCRAHNLMVHKRLKWNNKTQNKFMTSTAFHP